MQRLNPITTAYLFLLEMLSVAMIKLGEKLDTPAAQTSFAPSYPRHGFDHDDGTMITEPPRSEPMHVEPMHQASVEDEPVQTKLPAVEIPEPPEPLDYLTARFVDYCTGNPFPPDNIICPIWGVTDMATLSGLDRMHESIDTHRPDSGFDDNF